MFQVTGPTRGARRRPTVVLGAIVASAMLVGAGLTVNVLAVHDEGVFQLDGNAQTSVDWPLPGPIADDDWDRVCYQARIAAGDSAAAAAATCGTSSATAGLGGAKAVSWVSEPDRSTSIFTGGGSKDPSDLSNWLWKDAGGLPDKDNLRHAFAARYSNTDEFLYFGSDRFDNSGDAQQGFWFLQAPLAADGASSAGGFKFTDGSGGTPAHTVGDLLVISDFSNGGTVSTINIYRWVASGGDTTTHLDFVDGGIGVKCTPTLTSDNFCGIVNPTTTSSPWSFLDKSSSTSFLQGEFYEAGINLTNLGFGSECFSTVVAETRSSTSPTATLKDFVVGKFGECGSTLVTTPKNGDGTSLTADTNSNGLDETSIGTGTVTVKDSANLSVSGVSTFTGTLAFFLCGPIASGACSSGGVAAGSQAVTVNGNYTSDVVTLTSAGRYCWRGEFDATTAYVPDASDSTVEVLPVVDPPSQGKTGECFEVLPKVTSLDTQAVPSTVNFGQPVQDNATLSGTATQPGTAGPNATYPSINSAPGAPAGGKITFTLFGPSGCGTQTSGGTGTNPQDVTPISGNSTYGPVSYTPGAPGTYHWKAAYTPAATDVNNLPSTHNGTCSDSDEDVIVQQIPTTIATAQSWIPNDSATIDATAGGDLAGSVTFSLFGNSNCTGTALYEETVNIPASAGLNETVKTTNGDGSPATGPASDEVLSSSGTYSWLVVFASTNQAQLGSTSLCHDEHTDLTIQNNDPNIPPIP